MYLKISVFPDYSGYPEPPYEAEDFDDCHTGRDYHPNQYRGRSNVGGFSRPNYPQMGRERGYSNPSQPHHPSDQMGRGRDYSNPSQPHHPPDHHFSSNNANQQLGTGGSYNPYRGSSRGRGFTFNNRSSPICYYCGETGHIWGRCPILGKEIAVQKESRDRVKTSVQTNPQVSPPDRSLDTQCVDIAGYLARTSTDLDGFSGGISVSQIYRSRGFNTSFETDSHLRSR